VVLKRPFQCPVKVGYGEPLFDVLPEIINGRRYTIVTSNSWKEKNIDQAVAAGSGSAVSMIYNIDPNPKVSSIPPLLKELAEAEVILAIGGGSVLDTSKALASLVALDGDVKAFEQHLASNKQIPEKLEFLPIVAVPTTSGTGSEVTQWGTVWGDDATKYSVTDYRLYPSHAILDPALTCSMNRELTISTGLDALSHALESVWNKRNNPFTDFLAEYAIRTIHQYLQTAVDEPNNYTVRGLLQTASLAAGLAMGTTQTALSHSISYPLTAKFGIPHGIACSFTLGEVARYNMETHSDRLVPVARGLDCDMALVPSTLENWMKELKIGFSLSQNTSVEDISQLGDSLINPQRAGNNIRQVDGEAARLIAISAFKTFVC
jgi:phosphonate metabolism-associated iron-containing alcohol dehydrogenase